MKFELWIMVIGIFLIADHMNNNKYSQGLLKLKKHGKIAVIVFLLFCFYVFIKKNPGETRNMASHVNNIIKFMPIDKDSKDLITPFLSYQMPNQIPNQAPIQRMMNSGTEATGRSVSGTKKKFIAANQQWKCHDCTTQLDAWFEVDHKTRLADGGSNHISNLVALCRNGHGKKTTLENM